ncbi:MAG TPA: methionine ABC transporter ATP-binding protein [Bacillota bacterium]|nr:methionine ABC transporter ATP-binding protein [Bacillota bacterium]
MISIKGLRKIFTTNETEITAVDHLDLDIDEGEIFGVIGYSGAGKSTFVRLINRLEEPTAGKITIGGKDITSLKQKDLRIARRDIGMIFQHFNLLWSRTVAENISFPLEIAGVDIEERKQRVQQLIDLVGLSGREHAYPSQLSGGQKQRVGIARALANRPKILLGDEATSALDPETTDSILNLLVDINKKLNLTIILITHEMHVIRKICDRVAVMEDGKVVEQGDVLDVFTNPRQEVTKKFVGQVMGIADEDEGIQHIRESCPEGNLYQLHFIGEMTNQALISRLAKKFPIDIRILEGKITQTQHGAYGTLYVQMIGHSDDIAKCVRYIHDETSVKVEVVQDAN